MALITFTWRPIYVFEEILLFSPFKNQLQSCRASDLCATSSFSRQQSRLSAQKKKSKNDLEVDEKSKIWIQILESVFIHSFIRFWFFSRNGSGSGKGRAYKKSHNINHNNSHCHHQRNVLKGIDTHSSAIKWIFIRCLPNALQPSDRSETKKIILRIQTPVLLPIVQHLLSQYT